MRLRALGVLAAAVALAAPAAQASFPAKNGLIVFARYTGSAPGIYTIASNGTHLRRLVPAIARSFGAFTPVWSPDGASIAFYDWERRADTPMIEVVAAGGGHPSVAVRGTGGNHPSDPEWTADGRLSWQTPGASGGTCVQAEGETQPRFCATETLTNGRWSSTGRYAAVNAASSKLELVDESGAETPIASIYGWQFDWSPDGNKFVCALMHKGRVELVVVNVRGGGERLLPISGWQPAWSPDGKRIVFNDSSGIAVADANGSHLVQLTRNPSDEDPDWQPTSRA